MKMDGQKFMRSAGDIIKSQKNTTFQSGIYTLIQGMLRVALSLKDGGNRNFRIQDFFPELVIPFFYYLSYTDRYGIDASRKDLWGEYSHGDRGRLEYEAEILNIAKDNLSRNDFCTCGSGKKYKKCHMDEVEAVKRISLNYQNYQ